MNPLASLTLAIISLTPPDGTSERPPNIIFILADDLGYGELGCYGQEKIETPCIDRLAAEGIRFTQHYSGSPVCAPARCILLTGLHSGHAFIRDNGEFKPEGQRPITDETLTVAEFLKERGYATACMGKWGLGGPDSEGLPNRQGVDHFFGYLCQRHAHNHYPKYLWRNEERVDLAGNTRGLTGEQFSHDLMTEEALWFIDKNRAKPFFLYMAYAIPHLAIQVPDDSLAQYEGRWDDPPYEGGKGYLPHPAPRAGYAAMVSRLDRDVGRIADRIRELGLDEETLIIFSSDNGPTYSRLGGSDSDFFNSAAGFRGLKGSLHEGGIRIPLVARWPGKIEENTATDHISGFWDFFPTVADVVGSTPPEGLDGISFAPTLLGQEDQKQHDSLYWEFRAYGGQQALRKGDWKAIRKNMKKGNRVLSLYNLKEDPAESVDLAAEMPELVKEMEQIMTDSRTESEHFPLRWETKKNKAKKANPGKKKGT